MNIINELIPIYYPIAIRGLVHIDFEPRIKSITTVKNVTYINPQSCLRKMLFLST